MKVEVDIPGYPSLIVPVVSVGVNSELGSCRVKVEVAVQGYPSLIVPVISVPGVTSVRAQELCESRGGRPGLSVPNSPYRLCRRLRAQELCESRGGRPGLPSLINLRRFLWT